MSDFLRSFSLADLRPDSQTIQHAAGVIPQALSDTKDHFAFYFDGEGPMEVNLNFPSGEYSAEWISVSTGETTKREKFQYRGGEKQLQAPQCEPEIALRLMRTNP